MRMIWRLPFWSGQIVNTKQIEMEMLLKHFLICYMISLIFREGDIRIVKTEVRDERKLRRMSGGKKIFHADDFF